MHSPDQAGTLPRVGGTHLISINHLKPHPNELSQDPHTDTTVATARGGTWGGNDTPPLGLVHLRDNPECTRITAEAQVEPMLAQTPQEGSTTCRRDSTPTTTEAGIPQVDNHRRQQ